MSKLSNRYVQRIRFRMSRTGESFKKAREGVDNESPVVRVPKKGPPTPPKGAREAAPDVFRSPPRSLEDAFATPAIRPLPMQRLDRPPLPPMLQALVAMTMLTEGPRMRRDLEAAGLLTRADAEVLREQAIADVAMATGTDVARVRHVAAALSMEEIGSWHRAAAAGEPIARDFLEVLETTTAGTGGRDE